MAVVLDNMHTALKMVIWFFLGFFGAGYNLPLHLRHVATRHHSGRLVVDANLEAGGAPVDELNSPLVLDRSDRRVHVLRDHVAPVEQAAGHVLAVPGVALHHLVGGLEAGRRDVRHRHALVVGLVHRQDRGIGDKREVNPEEKIYEFAIDLKGSNVTLGMGPSWSGTL